MLNNHWSNRMFCYQQIHSDLSQTLIAFSMTIKSRIGTFQFPSVLHPLARSLALTERVVAWKYYERVFEHAGKLMAAYTWWLKNLDYTNNINWKVHFELDDFIRAAVMFHNFEYGKYIVVRRDTAEEIHYKMKMIQRRRFQSHRK